MMKIPGPRIIILAGSLPSDMTGGTQVQVEGTARALGESFDVVVVARSILVPPGWERRENYSVLRKAVLPIPGMRPVADAALTLWYVSRLRDRAIVLLGYQTLGSGLVAVLGGKLFGLAAIVFIRAEQEFRSSVENGFVKILSRFAWSHADRILLQSDRLRTGFLAAAATQGLDPARLARVVGVVPNGVALPSQEPAPDRPDRLIFVGRLRPMKGLALLLEALRATAPADRPSLDIFGDGPLEATLRAAARDLPVTFHGRVAHATVQTSLAQGGILVLPSLADEGVPNAIVEAMSAGLCVIGTPVGGVPDIIRDGENGLLVPPRDAASLQRAIDRLRRDPILRRRLSLAARASANEYAWAKLAARLAGEIDRALDKTRGPTNPPDRGERALTAANALRQHLAAHHGDQGLLTGPDSSGRINYRAGRFLKAALPFVPWTDARMLFQTQGYWALFNGALSALQDQPATRLAIEATALSLLERQQPNGSWEWAGGRVATFEGDAAALGLTQAYWTTGDRRYAEAAQRWVSYLATTAISDLDGGGKFVAYWSDRDIVIPNNGADVLWVMSEVAKTGVAPLGGDLAAGLVRFLASVQLSSGELPYRVGNAAAAARPHYLCFQYNAFEYLAIARYAENTGDPAAWPILERLAAFLVTGVAPNGGCRTSCQSVDPEVDYYTAILALALRRAEAGIGSPARAAADRLTDRLLSVQHADGSFAYSRRDYSLPFLGDRRSYPRTQAMIGYVLAVLAGLDRGQLAFERRMNGIAW